MQVRDLPGSGSDYRFTIHDLLSSDLINIGAGVLQSQINESTGNAGAIKICDFCPHKFNIRENCVFLPGCRD